MRIIRTSTGATLVLEGDVLAIMEVLYQEVTARQELARSFDDCPRCAHVWCYDKHEPTARRRDVTVDNEHARLTRPRAMGPPEGGPTQSE